MTIYPSKIKGSVKISGSKNAALPIIAASMVTSLKSTLSNVPNITDINNLEKILNTVGCKVKRKNKTVYINNKTFNCELLFDEVKKFRASYYLMSVFLALFNEVKIYSPGGCSIGKRPINFHLEGFEKAGCKVNIEEDVITIKAEKLKPFFYEIPKKSMGATVNLIILASKIEGLSIIKNASTEPEIDDLITYINKGTSKVYRKNDNIFIEGSKCTKNKIKHKIIPDRIECFTYICIGLNSNRLKIKDVNIHHLKTPIKYLLIAGANIIIKKNSVIVSKSKLKNIHVCSGDYPMLSTDQMPSFYPVFARVKGVSTFKEGIFENRFKVCEELKKTNAKINIDNNMVIIQYEENLVGCDLYSSDLRGAASLLIEGILNQNSTIYNLENLERGYDDIYRKLKKIGLNFILS